MVLWFENKSFNIKFNWQLMLVRFRSFSHIQKYRHILSYSKCIIPFILSYCVHTECIIPFILPYSVHTECIIPFILPYSKVSLFNPRTCNPRLLYLSNTKMKGKAPGSIRRVICFSYFYCYVFVCQHIVHWHVYKCLVVLNICSLAQLAKFNS